MKSHTGISVSFKTKGTMEDVYVIIYKFFLNGQTSFLLKHVEKGCLLVTSFFSFKLHAPQSKCSVLLAAGSQSVYVTSSMKERKQEREMN